MKVKIFTKHLKTKGGLLSGVGTVSDDGLEDELNLWLASQPNIDVEKVTQSESAGFGQPTTLTVCVWYQ